VPPEVVGPDAYARWRATTLGRVTEALEQRLMLELAGPVEGRRVLDVGCGDGELAAAFVERGAWVVGIDVDGAMLRAAAARPSPRPGRHAWFVQGRGEHLPFFAAAFDCVVAVTMLCFVSDRARTVRELARVLRPGGRLVIGELGRWSAWAARRRVRGWLGSRLWRAAHFSTAPELSALVEGAGLIVDAVRGSVFYPPVGCLARPLALLDRWLGPRTTAGAAFIAVAAVKPPKATGDGSTGASRASMTDRDVSKGPGWCRARHHRGSHDEGMWSGEPRVAG
jgi:SAM-dependent methyltransferase